MLLVLTKSYERVEVWRAAGPPADVPQSPPQRIALFIGLFELVFIVTMCYTLPSDTDFNNGVQWKASSDFVLLVAANIGAVVMPWMIFCERARSCCCWR